MQHADTFITYMQTTRRMSVHTTDAYRVDLQQFTLFLEQQYQVPNEAGITHHHIRSWVLTLREAEMDPKTIQRKLSCLKSWFKYMLKHRIVTTDPMLKVSTPKLPKRLPSVVQEVQMERLFVLIDFGSDFTGLRNRLIMELLYGTGIRRQELIQLKLQDLLIERGLLKIRGKGNKERLVPLPNYLQPLLAEYLALRDKTFAGTKEPFLLLTDKGREVYPALIYRVVHKYLSMVSSAEQRSPHTLRHSFATHLSNEGADLNAIKSLLGHSSLASTQVYMHNSINRLKAVYDQAHPKSKKESDEI